MIFDGEYKDGKWNGIGKEYYSRNGQLKYDGEYLNGKKNGKGKEYFQSGKVRYVGEYLKGRKINNKINKLI